MSAFTESVVEEAALAWLESLDWAINLSPEIAPGELAAELDDPTRSVLQDRECDVLLYKCVSDEVRIKDVKRVAGEVP